MNANVRTLPNNEDLAKLLKMTKKTVAGPQVSVISQSSITKQLAEKTNELESFKAEMIEAYNSLKESYQTTLQQLNEDKSVIKTNFEDASNNLEG